MDAGFFLSNKKRILIWIFWPIFLIAVLCLFSSIYFNSLNNRTAIRKSNLELMPVIDKKISIAKTILAKYEIASSTTDVKEMLNAQLNQLARRTGFAINSLSVEKIQQEAVEINIPVLKISVKGEGALSSIIGFFNAVHTSDKLFAVETSNIQMLNTEPSLAYSAEFIFFCYNLE